LNIDEEIKRNETSKVRIIGICIETRPDALIDENGETWLKRFRKWGVTRVQLGVQHTNNMILKKINRGHTIEDAEKAITYLKDNCFKVDIHLMPDLPFSSPEEDKVMIYKAFSDKTIQADQVKIYTCQVTPFTVIQQWHKTGKYNPYAQSNERALFDVVKYAMEICPPWIRIPRIVRDIPLTYVEGGNMYPNLRQMLTDELKRENKYSMDIRARECGRNFGYSIHDAEYLVRKYNTTNGEEYFISLESKDKKCIFGFLRLRIPYNYYNCEFDCLINKGLIREVHVYGNVIPVGYQKQNDSQHKGIGKNMIKIAKQISYDSGLDGIAVISGIGVTGYYKKLGFIDDGPYLVYDFKNNNYDTEENYNTEENYDTEENYNTEENYVDLQIEYFELIIKIVIIMCYVVCLYKIIIDNALIFNL
jgi:ELP3 family radical SAM enzyme/protein acetyltransferase